jgi:hypothetical protein
MELPIQEGCSYPSEFASAYLNTLSEVHVEFEQKWLELLH